MERGGGAHFISLVASDICGLMRAPYQGKSQTDDIRRARWAGLDAGRVRHRRSKCHLVEECGGLELRHGRVVWLQKAPVRNIQRHLDISAIHPFAGDAPEVFGRHLILEHDDYDVRDAVILDRPIGRVVAQIWREPPRHSRGPDRSAFPFVEERLIAVLASHHTEKHRFGLSARGTQSGSLAIIAGLREIDGESDSTEAGTVPREWFEHRLMGIAELVGTYADIGAAASLSLVRSRLAARAIQYGLADIDAAAIRRTAPRGFTQDVSRLVYECRAAGDQPFSGIQYQSRLDDRTSSWAIFEPPPGSSWPLRSLDVEPLDPDVTRALTVLGLRVG